MGPHLQQDVDKLERVQRKAARFIKKDYHSRHKRAMTMLHELDLPTLQSRRKENRLCFMYKISKGLVPAIPATDHLTREVDKRQRKENPKYKDYETTNYVTKHQRLNRHRKAIFQNDRKWSCDSLKEASIQPLHRTVFKTKWLRILKFYGLFTFSVICEDVRKL